MAILLLAGPPAAGKSSVARRIAAQAPLGLHIPVDTLRDMVHGGVLHPGPQWPAGLVEQLRLARQAACAMAAAYHAAGFVVVIDDFWDPHSLLAEYDALAAATPLRRLLLRPALATVLARNHARLAPGSFRRHMDDGIRQIDADLAARGGALRARGWQLLDPGDDGVDAAAARVLAAAGLLADPPVDPLTDPSANRPAGQPAG